MAVSTDKQAADPGTDRALFALWALFWLLMIVVAVEDQRNNASVQWWEPFLWEGSSFLTTTFWLILQRRVSMRWDEYLAQPSRWFARHLAWFPAVAVTHIAGIYSIRHGVYAVVGATYRHDPWAQVFVYETIKLLLYTALWLSIIFGIASFARWRRERERLLALQKHLAESQLTQLKAQLQPHFLFNALNTISSLMHVDVARADALLAQLADLLRSSLQTGARQLTSLREEVKLLTLYADIMRARFGARVSVTWDIAEDTLDAAVPTMLLQPLLENAFKHGVEHTSQSVAIRVVARREGEALRVVVHNTGGSLAAVPRQGIGLSNSRERLEVLYGEHARLDLAQDADGVAARLSLPYRREAA